MPSAHYGLAVSTLEQVLAWVNPLRARTRHWAWRGSVRHVPTGALVQQTDDVRAAMVRFVMAHLKSTGTFPELDQDAAGQLRCCFPMIS